MPGGPDSGEPDADPYCHYDCFGYNECSDGVVTTWDHAPVPCEHWEGECPHSESYTCERGCRADGVSATGPFEPPSSMCEEARPKQAGDPCEQETDCDPQVAEYDPATGTVTNVYLRCDLDLHMCVEREPTVIEDYLAPCGLVAPLDGPGYSYGFREVDVCSGGLCVYVERDTCVGRRTVGASASHVCSALRDDVTKKASPGNPGLV